MMEMSFGSDIGLVVRQESECQARRSVILTYRYPNGFKTGIEKERLVSIGCQWYRFSRRMNCIVSAGKPLLRMRVGTDVKVARFRKALAFLSIA